MKACVHFFISLMLCSCSLVVDQPKPISTSENKVLIPFQKKEIGESLLSTLENNEDLSVFFKELKSQGKHLKTKYTLEVCMSKASRSLKESSKESVEEHLNHEKIMEQFRSYVHKRANLKGVFHVAHEKTDCDKLEGISSKNLNHIVVINKQKFRN